MRVTLSSALLKQLAETSRQAEAAIRLELIDRLKKSGLNEADAAITANHIHAQVVRIDETNPPCGRAHHGFALILTADRSLFKAGLTARGALEELTEDLLAVHKNTAHEAILPYGSLMEASKQLAQATPIVDCAALEKTENQMVFGPTNTTPLNHEGKAPSIRIKSVLFARTLPDLVEGINTVLRSHPLTLSAATGRA